MKRLFNLFHSTTVRFIVVALIFQMVATGGVLFYVQRASSRALLHEQQQLVGELRDDLLGEYQREGRAGLITAISLRLTSIHSDIPVILLQSERGEKLAGNIGSWPAAIPYSVHWLSSDLQRPGGRTPVHMGVSTQYLPDGSRLLVGHVTEANVRLTQMYEQAMIAAFLLAIPLAFIVALIVGRIINARVKSIAITTQSIGEGNLSKRVRLDGSNDAFDGLGALVNAMLDRIEKLVTELRIVTDGLAHDLRSPITRLKSIVERAIIDTEDPETLAVLESVAREAETLHAMLSMTLQISRTEAGIGRDRIVSTNVLSLFNDIAEVYGPLIEDRGFEIEVDAPAKLQANIHRELVSQSIGNLLENAMNYAGEGKRIRLSAEQADHGIRLIVADNGQGIAEADRAEAIRRFGRLDPSRHHTGSGLGLSLVEAVARLHGGKLELADNHPGLKAILSLQA